MSSSAWATSFNSSSKARNSTKMSMFGDLQKKKGEKPLNSFFFSSFFLLYISCFFCLFCVWGHKFSFVGALMDFLRLYPVPIGLLGTASVTSQLGIMSNLGRLSGWFMNLVALLIEFCFNPRPQRGV